MLWRPLLACVLVVGILGGAELLWRAKLLRGEAARKFIHILAGCAVATMPFWLDYGWIVIFALGAIVLSLFNHYHRFFKAGLNVKRRSYGDTLFAIGILICALVQPNDWVFLTAILFVALGDGLAALVGTSLGHYHGVFYKILRHEKSAIGTATFVLVTFLVTAAAVYYSGLFTANVNAALAMVALPVAGAMLENVGIYGLDNLLLPVFVLIAMPLLAR